MSYLYLKNSQFKYGLVVLHVHCRAWNNCSTNVHGDGCTFYDLFIQILQYPRWSQFNAYDVTQQLYVNVIDALRHLCINVQPGTHSFIRLLRMAVQSTG